MSASLCKWRLVGDRANAPGVTMLLDDVIFAEGSTVQFGLTLFNQRGQRIEILNFNETVPVNALAWDYFEYLYYKFDRREQNFEIGKEQQNPLDIRLSFVPRMDAYTAQLDTFTLTPIYTDIVDPEDIQVLIKREVRRRRWTYVCTPLIPAADAVRITFENNTRVTESGDRRVSLVFGA